MIDNEGTAYDRLAIRETTGRGKVDADPHGRTGIGTAQRIPTRRPGGQVAMRHTGNGYGGEGML